MPSPMPPVPVADPDSAPFWDGLREHRLVVQACPSCGAHRLPPGPSCPWCGSPGADLREVDGRGSVYSWITVRRPLDPAFADELPYTLAAVDLDAGPRIVGRLEGGGDPPAIGDRVTATYHDHDGWTELRFVPDEDPS